MTTRPRAWALNLEAEAELEDPSARTPSRARADKARLFVGRMGPLIPPGDEVLLFHEDAARCDGMAGRAWCPTPGAFDLLRKAGADLPDAPPFAVLRRVNHRRFCAELGQTMEGARYVTTREGLDEALAGPTVTGSFLLKRPYGFSGRGRLRAPGAKATNERPLDDAGRRWIEGSLAGGEGLQVEPWVDITADFGIHGHLSKGGELVRGEPTKQRCDAKGAWLHSRRASAGELSTSELDQLLAAFAETGEALRAAGYFGPFGVDAFRYRGAGGAEVFQPRGEINARYSMGWATGMGRERPDL